MANKTKAVITIETHKVTVIRRILVGNETTHEPQVQEEIALLGVVAGSTAAKNEVDPDGSIENESIQAGGSLKRSTYF